VPNCRCFAVFESVSGIFGDLQRFTNFCPPSGKQSSQPMGRAGFERVRGAGGNARILGV
jgi:hypothetical protein